MVPNPAGVNMKRLQRGGHERKFFDSGDYMMCKAGASTEFKGDSLPTKVATKEDLHTHPIHKQSHLVDQAEGVPPHDAQHAGSNN